MLIGFPLNLKCRNLYKYVVKLGKQGEDFMSEEEKNLNYLFNEVPIYSKEKFKILDKTADSKYKINRQEFNRLYKYLNTSTEKLIINCVWCNRALSFDYDRKML